MLRQPRLLLPAALLLLVPLIACKSKKPAAEPEPAAQEQKKPAPALTSWTVDEGSKISFSSTKNGDVEVPGTIPGVSGDITFDPSRPAAVSGTIAVDLSTLDTGDPARDVNIKNIFFEVAKEGMGSAGFTAQELKTTATELPDGGSVSGSLRGQLRFHGKASLMEVKVTVSRAGDRITVKSDGGFRLQIWDWGLEESHKSLKTACGHEALSDTFPVSFELKLRPKG